VKIFDEPTPTVPTSDDEPAAAAQSWGDIESTHSQPSAKVPSTLAKPTSHNVVLHAPPAHAVVLVCDGGGLLAGVSDPFLRGGLALVIAGAVAALPWGILLLVLMPSATARLATSSRYRDLLDAPAAIRTVRQRFPAWNLAVVAIVTAWAIGLSGLGLALVGVVPGVLYAMLVSAHATASLADA